MFASAFPLDQRSRVSLQNSGSEDSRLQCVYRVNIPTGI